MPRPTVSGQAGGSGMGNATDLKERVATAKTRPRPAARPPFGGVRRCPRCAATRIDAAIFFQRYCRGGFVLDLLYGLCLERGEHFHRRCSRCEYGWVEAMPVREGG